MEWQIKFNVTQNGMSLKMEFHLKQNVTQNVMSLKIKFHSMDLIVNENGISLKKECHSKCNVTQNKIALKWNVIKNGVSNFICKTFVYLFFIIFSQAKII